MPRVIEQTHARMRMDFCREVRRPELMSFAHAQGADLVLCLPPFQ